LSFAPHIYKLSPSFVCVTIDDVLEDIERFFNIDPSSPILTSFGVFISSVALSPC